MIAAPLASVRRDYPGQPEILLRMRCSRPWDHVSNILAKLQVTDRAPAVVRARDAGLGHQCRT